MGKLIEEYLKEKDGGDYLKRVLKFSTSFNFHHSRDKEMIENMMEWAYNKGKEIKFCECTGNIDLTPEGKCRKCFGIINYPFNRTHFKGEKK